MIFSYVTASGDIPLRNLVYRVHDLPTSMKTLVYDFGELGDDAEKKYIYEIVKKHVSSNHLLHAISYYYNIMQVQRRSLCEVIANILNLSQKFIKKTTVSVFSRTIMYTSRSSCMNRRKGVTIQS